MDLGERELVDILAIAAKGRGLALVRATGATDDLLVGAAIKGTTLAEAVLALEALPVEAVVIAEVTLGKIGEIVAATLLGSALVVSVGWALERVGITEALE